MESGNEKYKVCTLCCRRVPVSEGGTKIGSKYVRDWIYARFYCNECLRKGRLYFAIFLVIAAALTCAVLLLWP